LPLASAKAQRRPAIAAHLVQMMSPLDTDAQSRANLPVFLIGCHRSGTTLAHVLLDAHPRIACPPESKFIAGLRSLMEYPQAYAALASLGFSKPQVHAALKAFTVGLFEDYARRRGKPRWMDKTPNYAYCLDFIDELFAEDVLFVFMVRHPFDTIHSLEEFGRGSFTLDDPDVVRHVRAHGAGRFAWATYWNDINARLLTFAAGHSRRCTVLRYEDLVREPEATLSGILGFIGEEFSPGMIDRAFAGDRKTLRGYGDHKVGRATAIHDQSLGKWRDWGHAERAALWRLVGDIAGAFGYVSEWSEVSVPSRHVSPSRM
jgi:protein-tyrosine sulfotransferase